MEPISSDPTDSSRNTHVGEWVEVREEPRRGGRSTNVAVNRRDATALILTDEEVEQLARGVSSDSDLHRLLGANGFLADTNRPNPRPRGGHVIRFLREFDLHWTGVHRQVEALHRKVYYRAWQRRWIVVQIVLGVMGVVAVVAAMRSDRALQLRPDVWEIPVYIGLSMVAIVFHELAHGLVIAQNGRRVAAVGFRLHLGSPAFYVESVEALLLPRRQRIVQAAAGPWAEWLFTSAVALVLWLAPTGDLGPIMQRFVLLTSFTIAANLLPFAGLDGALIFADLIREPNLALESRDAVDRLGGDHRPGDRPLVAYAAVNTLVSTGLFVTAAWFWYQLFGGVLSALASGGPLGWLAALTVVGVSFGPSVFATVPHLRRWSPVDRLVFRLERRSRVRLATLFAAHPRFAHLDERSLGVLAGQLRLQTVARWSPVHVAGFSGYLAIDGPANLGRDGELMAEGVARLRGPGLAASTQRLRRVRLGLLPDNELLSTARIDPPTAEASLIRGHNSATNSNGDR